MHPQDGWWALIGHYVRLNVGVLIQKSAPVKENVKRLTSGAWFALVHSALSICGRTGLKACAMGSLPSVTPPALCASLRRHANPLQKGQTE